MGNQLTPLASLCLGVVRGWINVAKRGKGGQIDEEGTAWTRLPADQLRDQLEREYMVEVSTRSIHRALKELTEANQLRRNQRWKHRYKRDYWYAIPEYEEQLDAHRPRSIASNYGWSETNPIASAPKAPALRPPQPNPGPLPYQRSALSKKRESVDLSIEATERVSVEPTMPIRSERSGSIEQNEVTGVSGQVLPTQFKNTQFLRRNRQKPKTERKDPLLIAVETCNAKGKTGGGIGFKEKPDQKYPRKAGIDHLGRVLTEIWVGGNAVMVVDDPKTAPVRR